MPEEVVDAEDLLLADRPVQLRGERLGRCEVVSERLLDHHARSAGEPGGREAADDRGEERRRGLEVEDRRARLVHRLGEPLVGRGIGEIAMHVGESRGQAVERCAVDLPDARLDRLAHAPSQLRERPVVGRHADDRAVEDAAALEAVERLERHLLREIPGDPEGDEGVC